MKIKNFISGSMLLGLMLLNIVVSAQEGNDVMDLETANAEFLEKLIRKKMNELRKEKNIHPLEKDEELYRAAKDQAVYMREEGDIGHDQDKNKRETPPDRVKYYGGGHALVGENVFSVPVKKEMRSRRKVVKLETYEEVANAIVDGWKESDEHLENILNEKYYKVGTGIAIDARNKQVYVAQVYGSMPYRAPAGVELPDDAYGVKPYDRSACVKLEREHGQLPELFSDNIVFNDNVIYLYFNSLTLFKKVFEDNDDAIALDLVQREQFKCGEGNRIFPSEIHEGMMMEPVNKNKMLRKNLLEEEGEVLVPLGQLPDIIDTTNTEFNLLIIKDGCLCNTIVYNNLRGENIEEVDIPWVVDTVRVTQDMDSIRKQLEFEIQFERNKAEYELSDIQPLLDSINLENYKINRVDIIAYSSLEGDPEKNRKLQQKRAKSILKAMAPYIPENSLTKVETRENWDGFFASIEGSPFADDYKGLSKKEVRAKINAMDTLDYSLEPYLRDQRKASVVVTVESVYGDSVLLEILRKRFDYAVKNGKYEKALLLQSIMFKKVLEKKIDPSFLYEGYDIVQKKETLPLKNNVLAFMQRYHTTVKRDSLRNFLDREILSLLTVNDDYPFIVYNDLILKLQEWSENFDLIEKPRELRKEIKRLGGSSIPKQAVNKLMLGYYLVAVEYFFDRKKFDEREDALEEIHDLFMQDTLDYKDIDRVTDYFIFQMRIGWALEILKPYVDGKEVDEHFLFKFINLIVYDEELKESEEYYDYFRKAAKINKNRFCNLFGYPNMSFQLLGDEKIKSIYCSHCSEKSPSNAEKE